jgi:hypothetical protein
MVTIFRLMKLTILIITAIFGISLKTNIKDKNVILLIIAQYCRLL